jgi:hypothetical protein
MDGQPWKRFFVHDPFGNRIEIHEPGKLRALSVKRSSMTAKL